MKLNSISNSSFLKKLENNKIKRLCTDMREFIIDAIHKNGGHLSPNLGSVESITMMHKVWNIDKDKFYFDIGHQTYVHKILTGRAKSFEKLRHLGGASGFLKRRESVYDIYEGGHSSSAVNVAVGRAVGRDLQNDNYDVVSYIGDASFTNGVTFEALNHIGSIPNKIITILNDNNRSISLPVGAVGKKIHEKSQELLGKDIVFLKKNDVNNPFFVFNINYIGVADGHCLDSLEKAYSLAKNSKESSVIHIVTVKGKGLKYAENDKLGIYHGVGPGFNIETGELVVPTKTVKREKLKTQLLYNYMEKDKNIVAISPAMLNYIGGDIHPANYKNRIYDVGIQEEHAALFGLGLADAGKKVYIDFFATFINRAYDMLVHDYTRMEIPAIISLNHTGIAPASGNTHHVLYQATALSSLPNTIIVQPGTTQDFYDIYEWAFNYNNKKDLIFIRSSMYPLKKVESKTITPQKLKIGDWKIAHKQANPKAFLICYDGHVEKFQEIIVKQNLPIQLVNALFLKPFDFNMLKNMLLTQKDVWIYDDTYFDSGLGSIVLNYLKKKNISTKNLYIKGFNKYYPHHGTFESILKESNHEWNEFLDIIQKKYN